MDKDFLVLEVSEHEWDVQLLKVRIQRYRGAAFYSEEDSAFNYFENNA